LTVHGFSSDLTASFLAAAEVRVLAVAVLVVVFADVAAFAPAFFAVFLADALFSGAFCSAFVTVALFDVAVGFRVEAFLLGAADFFTAVPGLVLPDFLAADLADPAAVFLLVLDVLDLLVEAASLAFADLVVCVAFLVVARAMTSPLSKQNRVAAATQRAERICLPGAGGNRSCRLVAKFFGSAQQTARSATETPVRTSRGIWQNRGTARRRRAE
jgi:hypothetical protein